MKGIEAIVKRRSVREYAARDVSEEDLNELLQAAMYAPTSRDNQATEFVIVREASVKEDLFNIAGQDFLRQAPLLIVPVTDPAKSHQPIQDLSIASTHVMLQAVALGLGTVWKNLSPEVAEAVKERLGIPANLMVINMLPVGTPAVTPAPHRPEECEPRRIHVGKW